MPGSDDPESDRVSEANKKFDAALADFLDSNSEVLQEDDMKHQFSKKASQFRAALTSLTMKEVQGSEDKAGVQLGTGSTVVLSACNTGRGNILAEGVVGLTRGFLLAGAAAAVVSLWSVDDGSTAALMVHMYQHLVKGCTVPQALRLAMLRLARRPTLQQPVPHGEETDAADLPDADAAEGARGSGGELGGFRKLEGGAGMRSAGAGAGGVVPVLQEFLDILEGVGQKSSSRGAGPTVIAIFPVENEAERRAYWREFCKRKVGPTAILDFPFADHGGLNLMDAKRLFERIYCFEDREDDTHHLLGGRRRRVLLKVHTLREWGDRGDKLYLRATKVTAVKVMFVWVVAAACLPAAGGVSPAERASDCKCTLFVVSASQALLLWCCICCFLFAADANVHWRQQQHV